MKKPFLFFILLGFSIAASAQKVFYVYFQTEDQSTFFVKLNNKVFNSASAGYLTISNLRDTTYSFQIGLAANPMVEKTFLVKMNGSDQGLSIKKQGDNLVLFDMQNQVTITPQGEEKTPVVYETKTDRFSTMLSKAADDPSLLKKPVPVESAKPQEAKKESAATVMTEEPPAAVNTAVATSETVKSESKREEKTAELNVEAETAKLQENKPEPIKKVELEEKGAVPAETTDPQEDYRRSKVSRFSETSTTEGFGLVYHDDRSVSVDTIRLLIPNPTVNIASKESPKTDESFFLEVKEKPVEKKPVEKKPVEKEEPKKQEVKKTDAMPEKALPVPADIASASNCVDVASEKDFFKLRRNMAGKTTDESMVDEARKMFKKQCFTTEQIRHLSSLFLTSAGKYLFFDAAFPYASDREHFSSLKSEITDPYYLNRFKALVGE